MGNFLFVGGMVLVLCCLLLNYSGEAIYVADGGVLKLCGGI